MCTVTWFRREGGYELFSNRDERRTRPPAEPPRALARGTLRYLAPVDAEAGGSWIAANELGVTLCLLNLYEVAVPALAPGGGELRSRGLLVTELADAGDAGEAAERLLAADLSNYRPFTLLALDPAGAGRLVRWDGERAVDLGREPAVPLVSSGFDVAGATAARGRLLAAHRAAHGGLSSQVLRSFHASHLPERGPYSPCMHRLDARTVSCSWVEITPEATSFRYAAGPPCTAAFGEPVALARVASGAAVG
jgi:hypothetical protein